MIHRKFPQQIFSRARINNPSYKWRELIKMMIYLLAVREISLLEFEKLCSIHLQKQILYPVKHLRRTFLQEKLAALI